MGSKEEFLSLLNRFNSKPTLSDKPTAQLKDRLAKEHEEMMRLLNNEESISRELTKKTL
jgi:hypothetical protein